MSTGDAPKKKIGRPKSPDTDPRTGRRGKVLAIQMDDVVMGLIDLEIEIMASCGHTLSRSDACRAMLRRAGLNPPPVLLEIAERAGRKDLLERHKQLCESVASAAK